MTEGQEVTRLPSRVWLPPGTLGWGREPHRDQHWESKDTPRGQLKQNKNAIGPENQGGLPEEKTSEISFDKQVPGQSLFRGLTYRSYLLNG